MKLIESITNLFSTKRPGRTLLLVRLFSPRPASLSDFVDRLSIGVIYFGLVWILTEVTFPREVDPENWTGQ
jgi:hypothetical protein